jgi:predicted O-linked N-acetylglucosamine transferase (SPINDLY family)
MSAASGTSVSTRLAQASQWRRARELALAEAAYSEILGEVPDQPQALHGMALLALGRGELEAGIRLLERSLQADPAQVLVLVHLARARLQLGQAKAAIAACDAALALDSGFADAYLLRGDACMHLELAQAALESYDRLLAVRPDEPSVLCNRGLALQALNRLPEALGSYDRSLAIAPAAAAYVNRGNVLSTLRRYEEAQASYEAALHLAPRLADGNLLLGSLLHARAQCCDWRKDEALRRQIIEGVRAGRLVSHPWLFLTAFDEPALHRQCAEIYTSVDLAKKEEPLWRSVRHRHERIRVAYLSADFREHPTAMLTAGLFEAHDRQRFETIGVSLGSPDSSAMGRRVQSAFERFLEVNSRSQEERVRELRSLKIDIAVDLMGVTAGHRADLLARRLAPIQVSYLGYPGTLALPSIDYILADRTVLPREQQAHYCERVVYLPDSYQVNDSRRGVPAQVPSRAEAGLPPEGFVFASFNAHHKITATLFDIWMRLLAQIPGSVLWLLADSPVAHGNLRREAAARGVDPVRLIFAPRMAPAAHLARQILADLMLDTLPYNAHTTCSDALWVGLPVLTCQGVGFASRVAASVLKAARLPELITHTLTEYESLARELATQPARLDCIRARLIENRTCLPLFDTARTCRHMEAAYVTMWERHQDGLPPQGFTVS